MSDPKDLESEREEASLEAAVEAADQHEAERDAAHRQGLIDKVTRDGEREGWRSDS